MLYFAILANKQLASWEVFMKKRFYEYRHVTYLLAINGFKIAISTKKARKKL